MRRLLSIALLLPCFVLTADNPAPPPPWVDVTGTALRDAGDTYGAAWADVDNDGDLDLYLSVDGPNKFFRNEGDGTLVEATPAVLADAGDGRGSAWGDYDNDGDLDLYIVNTGLSVPNRLVRNDEGSFVDVTQTALGIVEYCRAAFWVDDDNDGDLDLYVLKEHGLSERFVNDAGVFVADTPSLLTNDGHRAKAATWGDVDGDLLPDLFLANYDDQSNRFLRNNGDGSFSDVTTALLAGTSHHTSAAWVDVDNDEDLDVSVLGTYGYGSESRLQRNLGSGLFGLETPDAFSVISGSDGGQAWLDYDLDGDLDVFVGQSYSGPNALLRNEGGWVFVDETTAVLADNYPHAQAVVWGDFDNDGDLDLFAANNGGDPNRLFRNDQATGNHWLQIRLQGVQSNRRGIGARVRAVTGGSVQTREIQGGVIGLGQNDQIAAFGLGSATVVDLVQVLWPSGTVQNLVDVPADQKVVVTEAATVGVGDDPGAGPSGIRLLGSYPNPFRSSTVIAYELPRPARVDLRVHGLSGNLVRVLETGRERTAGVHEVAWDGRDDAGARVSPGVLFYTLQAEGAVKTHKLLLLP